MQADSNLTGQFLIAMPGLSGALGDILVQTEMAATSDEIAATPVYSGGPVNPERCLVMHRPIGDWAATLQVTDEVGVTGSADVLEAIASGEGPDRFLVCLGYSGWGPGQLDDEILRNDWLITPANDEIMFQTTVSDRWRAALALIGVDPSQLSSDAGHA